MIQFQDVCPNGRMGTLTMFGWGEGITLSCCERCAPAVAEEQCPPISGAVWTNKEPHAVGSIDSY
jgi:hypothetical protein